MSEAPRAPAAVLAMAPEVLLLDAETRKRLIAFLDGLPQAMVVISHDEDFLARIARRRMRLERGRWVERRAGG